MKTLKNLFLLIALLAFGVACDEDDDTPPADGSISAQNDPDLIVGDLKGNVTADITLAASESWLLTGPLHVKSGATLTIEAGTTIKAAAGGTNVYIAVEAGAKIMAQGTSSAPIRITSNAASPAAGDWGGLLVIGNAPISGGGNATTEVVALTYGGTDASDNSGVINYMILEYTGARINGDKEFNGFTFYAVGSGTQISNIVAAFGDDDAIEWFGGTVNVSGALVVNAKDDMFDWTQGWTGTGSNFYGVRRAGFTAVSEDPRGIEGDGNLDGNSPSDNGQSNPTINGITLINNAAVSMSDMIKIRRGSNATVTNAYVAWGTGASASDFIDFADRKGNAVDATTVTAVGNPANGLDINDITRMHADSGTTNATANVSEGTMGGTDLSMFSWSGWAN